MTLECPYRRLCGSVVRGSGVSVLGIVFEPVAHPDALGGGG